MSFIWIDVIAELLYCAALDYTGVPNKAVALICFHTFAADILSIFAVSHYIYLTPPEIPDSFLQLPGHLTPEWWRVNCFIAGGERMRGSVN